MKKRIYVVMALLLASLAMFASCKHKGLELKDGSVQIQFSNDYINGTYNVPVELYDAIFEEFKVAVDAYNSDRLLTKNEIKDMDHFCDKLRPNTIEELVSIVPSEKQEELIEEISSMDNFGQIALAQVLDSMYGAYYLLTLYLEEVWNLENDQSWFDSKEESIEAFKEYEEYEILYSVMNSCFPKIKINKK